MSDPVETMVNGIREAVLGSTKLTPRQNELISEALCKLVLPVPGRLGGDMTPERLKELRRALVDECEAVTAETDLHPSSSARCISG